MKKILFGLLLCSSMAMGSVLPCPSALMCPYVNDVKDCSLIDGNVSIFNVKNAMDSVQTGRYSLIQVIVSKDMFKGNVSCEYRNVDHGTAPYPRFRLSSNIAAFHPYFASGQRWLSQGDNYICVSNDPSVCLISNDLNRKNK